MATEPLVKAGTVIRLPITIRGFIELRGLKPTQVVVDRSDWEYGAWPRVSPMGEDAWVMQFDDGPEARRLEGDVELIETVRVLVNRFLDRGVPWIVSDDTDEITEGTA